jgi:hypothetical protein
MSRRENDAICYSQTLRFCSPSFGELFVAGLLLALAERTLCDAVVKASEVDDAGD